MEKLTRAAELVLQHHQDKVTPSYASHLVGHFPDLPDEQALAAAYAELLKAGPSGSARGYWIRWQ